MVNDSSSFRSTRWSVVSAAGRTETEQSKIALATLLETYWHPVYSFIRRSGHQPADAQDLAQGFFAEVMEKNSFASADSEKGKFRSFLLTLLKRYMIHEARKENAQKRGGGKKILSLDFESGEKNYSFQPVDDEDPDAIFNRRWAIALLDSVLNMVADEYSEKGKSAVFEELKVFISANTEKPDYPAIASRLGISDGAVRVAIHRIRQKYRNFLRLAVADTVQDEDQISGEIADLMKALAS